MNAGKAEKINRFIRDFGRVAVAIGPGEWRLFFEHGATYGRAPAKHLNAICGAAPLSASGTGSATARMCAQRSSRRVSWPFISGSGGGATMTAAAG